VEKGGLIRRNKGTASMDDKDVMRRAISIEMEHLLATYEPNHYGTAEQIKLSWLMATASFDAAVVLKAVGRFLAGKVDEQDAAILPTAPEIARECQMLVYENEASGFDIGFAMAETVASDLTIQRQAELSDRLTETAAELGDAPNVTLLRQPAAATGPLGAA
jgi:hypothetical protein